MKESLGTSEGVRDRAFRLGPQDMLEPKGCFGRQRNGFHELGFINRFPEVRDMGRFGGRCQCVAPCCESPAAVFW